MALPAAMVLLAAACGGEDSASAPDDPPPAPAPAAAADDPPPPPDPPPAAADDDTAPADPPPAPADPPPAAEDGDDSAAAVDPLPAPAVDPPPPPPDPPPPADDEGDGAPPAEPPPAPQPPPPPPPPPSPPQPTTGFDGSTIKLGYLTDLSGPLAIVGTPLLAGSQLYWDWVNNELGGIAGQYKVELVAGDTKDSEGQTVQEYQRLKDDVALFAEVLSTPPTQALLDFLKEDNVVAVPGSLAGAWVHELLLLPNAAPYEYEVINLLDWYVGTSGLANPTDVYCTLYVNDKYGTDTLRGLEFAIDRLGLELAERQTINRGDRAFTAQVTAFSDAGCTVVIVIMLPTEQNAVLAESNSQGFDPIWLGTLPSYLNLFALGNPDLYTNFYIALDFPELTDTSVPGLGKFLERFERYGSGDVNTFLLSGYVQQYSVHALLEKAAELGDLSRAGMVAAMEQLGEVDVEGLVAANWVYGAPENRVPAAANRIFAFDPTLPPLLLRELVIFRSSLIDDFDL